MESVPALTPNGTLIVSNNMTLCALDIHGKGLWNITVNPSPSPLPLDLDPNRNKTNKDNRLGSYWMESHFLQPVLSPDFTMVYVTQMDVGLHAVYVNNGTVKWVFPGTRWAPRRCPATAPAVGTDGMIHVGNQGVLYCLYPNNGSVVWQVKTGGELAGLGVAISPIDGTLYMSYEGGYLVAVSRQGKEKWVKQVVAIGDDVTYFGSPIVDLKGDIYVGGADYVVRVASNGTTLMSTDTGACA